MDSSSLAVAKEEKLSRLVLEMWEKRSRVVTRNQRRADEWRTFTRIDVTSPNATISKVQRVRCKRGTDY
jgi:hypothetical protein